MPIVKVLFPNQEPIMEFVHIIVSCLVDRTDRVSIEATLNPHGTAIRISVDKSDLIKVIGKQGHIAKSLRILLGAASMKARHRYTLDIGVAGMEGSVQPKCEGTPSH
jgi:predicted RNA-binding protein YlqC (UPF0109 family)